MKIGILTLYIMQSMCDESFSLKDQVVNRNRVLLALRSMMIVRRAAPKHIGRCVGQVVVFCHQLNLAKFPRYLWPSNLPVKQYN